MKIGILGSGDVAKALGGGFVQHGHDVTLGTRTPAKLADWAKQHPQAHIGSFADAARFAELGGARLLEDLEDDPLPRTC
jgi:hypothetical protein